MTSVLPGGFRAAVIRNVGLTRQILRPSEAYSESALYLASVPSKRFVNHFFTSAKMEGNAASYQEKVERTPGDKYPEADTQQKDVVRNSCVYHSISTFVHVLSSVET